MSHSPSDPQDALSGQPAPALSNNSIDPTPLLKNVWERQKSYSQNASNAQERFFTLERIISLLAVAVVVLAVAQPIVLYRLIDTPALYEKRLPLDLWINLPRHWLLGLINLLLIFLPITITALRAYAIKFSRGNSWVLLRGSAEALKMEIFYFRTQVKHYRTNRNTELVNRLQLISKRLEGSAVQQRALYPYENQPKMRVRLGILLRWGQAISTWSSRLVESCLEFLVGIREEVAEKNDSASQGHDDRMSDLNPESYIKYRLENQFAWYRQKAIVYDRQHQIYQTGAYIFGGLGTLLAALGFQAWVAVTAAMATALISYLQYHRIEATLMGYTQAADTLYDIRTWWLSLSNGERADFENFEKLVVNTEETIRSENNSWLQDMQDRLANLYDADSKDETSESDGKSTDDPGSGSNFDSDSDPETKPGLPKPAALSPDPEAPSGQAASVKEPDSAVEPSLKPVSYQPKADSGTTSCL